MYEEFADGWRYTAIRKIDIRIANIVDLDSIIGLLIEDEVFGHRESASPEATEAYRRAFTAIAKDPRNELYVAEMDGRVVGCYQLTIIPNLTMRGGWRAQVEGVMVAAAYRGQGIGTMLMEHAIAKARKGGCALVQLTTNKQRTDAHRFYQRLGFVFSHEGAKLILDDTNTAP